MTRRDRALRAAALVAGCIAAGGGRLLYPDRALFEREEQRRFELLLAHWDLPVRDAPLDR